MSAKRGRPASFSRDDLIAAALRLGPERLTVQALADELGLSRTTLYWHVRDLSEVGEMVLTHLLQQAGPAAPAPGPDSWDEWLGSYARSIRNTLVAAGGWMRFTSPRRAFTPESLLATDRLVAALLDAGFSPEEALMAFMFTYQVAFAAARAVIDTPVVAMRRSLIAEVDSADGELPALRRILHLQSPVTHDQQFEYDLDCVLRGISSRTSIPLGRPAEGRRRRRAR